MKPELSKSKPNMKNLVISKAEKGRPHSGSAKTGGILWLFPPFLVLTSISVSQIVKLVMVLQQYAVHYMCT